MNWYKTKDVERLILNFIRYSITHYLSCHDSLSLLNEVTLGTLTISVLASSLVTLEPWYQTMIPTPGTLGSPQRILSWVHLSKYPTVLYQWGAVSDWEGFNICDTFQMDLISGLLWGVPASSSLMRWYIDTVPIGRLHQRHRILRCYWLTGAASVSICSDVVTHHVTDEQLSKYSKYYQHYVSLTTLGST